MKEVDVHVAVGQFLMSTANCITPFHYDSGGADVRITIVEGEKDWFWMKGGSKDAYGQLKTFGANSCHTNAAK